jgi:hypothetical protein
MNAVRVAARAVGGLVIPGFARRTVLVCLPFTVDGVPLGSVRR